MPKPYSNDLRERAVKASQSGESCRVVALRYGVAVSTIVKWAQRYREKGNVTPDKIGGYRPFVLEPHREFILDRLQHTSHLTILRLQEMLAKRDVIVSHDTIWRFLRREGLSFKKKPFCH